MRIHVKGVSCYRAGWFEVAASDSVESLKMKIQAGLGAQTRESAGIHPSDSDLCNNGKGNTPDQQAIIFAGRQLEDERALADYGIEDNSVLHIVTR